MSTVDDIDSESGRLTSALALGDLTSGGQPGQYGTGQGAASVTVPRSAVAPGPPLHARPNRRRVSDVLPASVLR